MTMKKLLFCQAKLLSVLFVAVLISACGNAPKYNKSIPAGFDALCQRAIDEWKVPGMAVAVVKDGEVVFMKGYGNARLGDSLNAPVPVTPQTQFVIASTSKAFTSGLLANVMDEYPEIKWDAPVKKYLPDFKMYDPWVTENFQVREIMSHHSGFNAYALDDLPTWGYDRDDLYRIYSVLQPTYSFRTKYAYNNSMYTISAKIIEKYTGKSWDEAIAERIFTPLEMKNSTTGNVSFYTAENLAQGYRMRKAEDKNEIEVVPRTDKDDAFAWLSAVAPAGFVISTVEDMANWVKMHLNHGTFNGKQIISRENHDMLFYPQTITGSDSTRLTNYAQGWTVEYGLQGRYIRHTGLAYGYTALVGLHPELNLGFVFLTNNGSSSDPQSAIGRDLIELYKGNAPHHFDEYLADYLEDLFGEEKDEKKPEETPVAALANKAYVGNYTLEPFGTAKVYEKDGSLYFNLRKVDAQLEHKNGNVFKFYQPGSGTFDLTFTVKGGRAQSLTFNINDPVGEFVRR
ncbi:MAG: serine hydrolase [Bacteroidales bacterium]|nr:serine hydrolase [Bacteroidales bacterium]